MNQLSFEGIEKNTFAADYAARGFSIVSHGIPSDAIDQLIVAYADFTDNLPDPSLETMAKMITDPCRLDDLDYAQDDESDWHKYRTNYSYVFKPGGYTNRSLQAHALREVLGLEVRDDPKEYFHYLHRGMIQMRESHERYGWGSIPPEVLELDKCFSRIRTLGVQAVQGVLADIEAYHPDIVSRFATPEDIANSPLRLLFYHADQGEELAGGHYDKTIVTAQLAESHVGLRIRDPKTHDMQVVNRPPDKAAVFTGSLLTLDHVYPESQFIPGWHDVINIDTLNTGRRVHGTNVARWALILFVNSLAAGEVDKTLTHTERSQSEAA